MRKIEHLNLQTEMVNWDGAVRHLQVLRRDEPKGQFIGTWNSKSGQRDARLAESLVELAETEHGSGAAICWIWSLNTGAEEVSHVAAASQKKSKVGSKEAAPVFPEDNGNGKGETKAPSVAPAETRSKPQPCGIGQATQAQCRALYALTKRANYQESRHWRDACPLRCFPL